MKFIVDDVIKDDNAVTNTEGIMDNGVITIPSYTLEQLSSWYY
jgi:hypothetical protein